MVQVGNLPESTYHTRYPHIRVPLHVRLPPYTDHTKSLSFLWSPGICVTCFPCRGVYFGLSVLQVLVLPGPPVKESLYLGKLLSETTTRLFSDIFPFSQCVPLDDPLMSVTLRSLLR